MHRDSAMMRKDSPAGGTEFTLDGAECINLQRILQAFNSTISEEHAWALFYQAARCFQKCLAEGNSCYLISEPRHVLLHKDGSVHPRTLQHPGGKSLSIVTKKPVFLIRNMDRIIFLDLLEK